MRPAITSFSGEHRFLSNFWPARVVFEGQQFASTENAYQAAKTIDSQERNLFLECSPGQAKRMSRKIHLRSDWENIKLGVMLDLVRQKFVTGQDAPVLGPMLLATADNLLIEGNTWNDRFWGECPIGVGENNLGKILMQVRMELKS